MIGDSEVWDWEDGLNSKEDGWLEGGSDSKEAGGWLEKGSDSKEGGWLEVGSNGS